MAAESPALFCVDDPRFDRHHAAGSHPERPERLAAVRRGLVTTLREGGAELITPREASNDELLRVHSPEHVATLEHAFEEGQGYLDADTFFSEGSRAATLLAAGAGADLAARLMAKSQIAGVLAGRPPGHHATRTQAMGFCLLNNVAVAAAEALARGAERVAIVDWDVHHGNGTEAIFEADPRVLFISLHQWPLYPGTGKSRDIGTGEGKGSTINLPLPPASSSKEYAQAMRQVVLPALAQFSPDAILVSSGFDAHQNDPLAGMSLRDEDFGAFTTAMWQMAEQLKKTRLGIVLEGGYDLDALERASRAVGDALLGKRFELEQGPIMLAAQRAIDDTRTALKGHFEL
jgi:acetoin utilization deacetylase AcuC-like enzyme